jgi:hypothetical protein
MYRFKPAPMSLDGWIERWNVLVMFVIFVHDTPLQRRNGLMHRNFCEG